MVSMVSRYQKEALGIHHTGTCHRADAEANGAEDAVIKYAA